MSAVEKALPVDQKVEQCQRLARVLTQTKQMLGFAENNDWETVASMDKERREDLLYCFSMQVNPVDSELFAEAIAALLHLNEELMAKLQVARDSVMEQGIALSRNRRVAGQYQDIKTARG